MTTVSLQTIASLFGDGEALLAPVVTQSAADGTSILSFVLTADGDIPAEGLIVTVNSNIQFRDNFAFLAEEPFQVGGELVGAVFNEAGEATGFRFKMTASKALINLRPQDNLDIVGDRSLSFSLETGEGYSIDPAASRSIVTFYESLATVPTPTVTPEVSLSIDTTTISEATGNTTTLTFRLSEPPPPEGVLLQIKGDSGAGTRLLSEFDLFNATVTGGGFPAPDGAANGFFFKVTEQTATITLPAFKDEDLEGVKEVKLKLLDASGYTIAPDAGAVTLNIVDDANSQIQVSFTTQPAVLVESAKTVSVHNFSLSATPPAEGLVVSVLAPNISEFDLSGIVVTGGEIARLTPTGFDLKITAKNATIELPVANDGVAEGSEEAIFTLQDAPGYQVNPAATQGKFQIVDTSAQAPVLTVNEPNDTIATAVDLNLNPENSLVSVNSSIGFSFRNSYDDGNGGTIYVDASEDVDLYKVSLKAGDKIYIDTDSNQFAEGRKVDTWLRVFDPSGTQLATNDDGAAPDEIFTSRFQSYLEFTAATDGEYFVGVSLYPNGSYDPNVPGSGGGSSSADPNEFGTGDYTLNIGLNQPIVPEPTSVPIGGRSGPAISLFTVAGTYGNDFDNLGFNIRATGLAESTGDDAGSALNFVLTTADEIPAGGVEVIVASDIALTDYFGDISEEGYTVPYGGNLNNLPFTRGGQFLEAVYDTDGKAIGFKFRLEESFATIVLNPTNRSTAETNGAETATFTLLPTKGYTVTPANSSTVTFYDTIDQIPAAATSPTVSLALSTTELVESEETELTLTLSLSEPPPAGGVQVYVSGNAQDFLNELAIFEADITGGVAIADGAVSGFYFQMFEQTATITLPVFNSADIVEGIEAFNLEVRPGAGYTVNAAQNGGTILIKDAPDSQIQVSLSSEPPVLIESEGTVAKVNLSLSAAPPAEGILVTVNAAEMIEFDPKSLTATGADLVSASPDNTSFTLRIRELNASISVAVANDGVAEGAETAIFSLAAGAGYQINPDASSGTFTIVDTLDQAPTSTAESNDTLDTAIATGLTASNRSVSFDGEIGEHSIELSSGQSVTIDATEDVDLYKVELAAGQDLIIDVDATEIGSKLQFSQIRVFDSSGRELAKTGANSFQAAPDEVFSVFNDPYLEFTAASAGTYFVGISQIGNDSYDPTVAGSGSGWIFPAAEILPDKYTLNLSVGSLPIIDPPPPSDTVTIAARSAYYTYEGNISSRSNVRLLADKANAIGFPGRETISFLQFDPASLPADLLDQEFEVTLTLEHDAALGGTLIPATDARPVSLSVYDLAAPFTSTRSGGNLADIDYGNNGANAVATISIGNDGLYNWDITSLIQEWAIDATNNDGLAISGVFGNVNTDGRNSYGIFHTVGSTTGQVPTLTIKLLGDGGSSPQTRFGSSASEQLAGGAADDILYGNGGEDVLTGRAGDDLIYGGSQADIISAGSGDDVIYANGGGDLINAGTGIDTVWLGSGAATIVLNSGEGFVTVKNFQLGATQFRGAGAGLAFADSADGVRISQGDDLLAVVSWQTASTFSSNAAAIFA